MNQTVFENLCQIVDFYATRDLVRGVCLKIPVNEKNLGQYTGGDGATGSGTYMDLKDLDKEVEAVAVKAYNGQQKDALTFPLGAVITVIKKDEGLWKGRYSKFLQFSLRLTRDRPKVFLNF